eukprot:gb/GECG01009549.1/.p1 GENE.gb/GECG01009549.1/~~gb/GECG01009549.1/.p1  ORF type:complete len:997 (+),score=129.48 gb/GECG01009549.1/:1-2991(+)
MDDIQVEATSCLLDERVADVMPPAHDGGSEGKKDDSDSALSLSKALEPVPDQFESVEQYKTIFTKLIVHEMQSQLRNILEGKVQKKPTIVNGGGGNEGDETEESELSASSPTTSESRLQALTGRVEALVALDETSNLSRLSVRFDQNVHAERARQNLKPNFMVILSLDSDTVNLSGNGKRFALGLTTGSTGNVFDFCVNSQLYNNQCTPDKKAQKTAGTSSARNASKIASSGELFVWPLTNVISSLRELEAVVSIQKNVAQEISQSIVYGQIPGNDGTLKFSASNIISPDYSNFLQRTFNKAQQHAIAEAARRRGIVLVQGPPGTGKTSTILGCLNTLHVEAYGVFHERMVHGDAEITASNRPTKPPAVSGDSNNRDQSRKRSRGGVSDIMAIWQTSSASRDDEGSVLDKVLRVASTNTSRCNSLISWLSSNSSNEIEVLSGTLGVIGLKPRILVAAPSNAAVDNVIEKIMQSGFKDGRLCPYGPAIVRVGQSYSLPIQNSGLSLSQQVDNLMNLSAQNVSQWSQKLREDADLILKELKRIRHEYSSNDSIPLENVIPNLVTLLKNFHKIFTQYRRLKWLGHLFSVDQEAYKTQKPHTRDNLTMSLLDDNEIIFSTLSSSALRCIEDFTREYGRKFETVVVDEAAQAIEASSLIPLKYHCNKLVLVGDPQQLPATVVSPECKRMKLDQSLFARLVKCGYPSHLLDTQYRMHPHISEFPSKHFYGGRLRDADYLIEGARSQPFHKEKYFRPLEFFQIESTEGTGVKRSMCNIAEAQFAIQLIFSLMLWSYYSEEEEKEIRFNGTIGVISPYRGQVDLLRSMYERAIEQHNAEERFKSSKRRFPTCPVRIDTVDSYQGQESDVIILSLTRSWSSPDQTPVPEVDKSTEGSWPSAAKRDNSSQSIGFLRDVRRMNVAMTRAKYSLWVLGNADVLSVNSDWKAFIDHVRARDCFVRAEELSLPGPKDTSPTEIPPQSQPGYPYLIVAATYDSTVTSSVSS